MFDIVDEQKQHLRDLETLAGGVTVWQVPPKGKILQCYLYLKRSSSVDPQEAKKPPPPPRRLFGGNVTVPAPPPTPRAERSQSEKTVPIYELNTRKQFHITRHSMIWFRSNIHSSSNLKGRSSTWCSLSKPRSSWGKSTTRCWLDRAWSMHRRWACRCGRTRRRWTWCAPRWRISSAGAACSLCCVKAKASGPLSAAERERWEVWTGRGI